MTKTITLDTDLIRRDNMIHHLETVNAQQAERIKALEAVGAETLEFLREAPFDFANGNEVFGVDEGDVVGRRYVSGLIDRIAAVLDAQKGGGNG